MKSWIDWLTQSYISFSVLHFSDQEDDNVNTDDGFMMVIMIVIIIMVITLNDDDDDDGNCVTEQTKEEVKNTQEERDRMVKERDEEIAALKVKVNSMENAYEGVLRVGWLVG